MPKLSGESLKVTRAPPRPQPSRAIHHQPDPAGPKTAPNAMGASKRADALKPSPQKSGPARGGKMPGQMVY
jgi:hypothetical protein